MRWPIRGYGVKRLPESIGAFPNMKLQHPIIAGRSQKGSGHIDVISPATEEKVAEVTLASSEDIDSAVERAALAWPYWHGLAWSKKRDIFENLLHLLVDRAAELAHIIATEQGKPINEALAVEIFSSADHVRFLAAEADRILRPRGQAARQPLFLHKKAQLRPEPYGPVLIISPWNYPFAIPFIQAVTALAAGNSLLIKPSPVTPLSALAIGRLLLDSGVPEPVIHVLPTSLSGAERLAGHPLIRKIIFTGSTETGRRIQQLAARNVTPVVLELGGKDAAIVLDDADLDRTARGLCWGAFFNAGQTCASIERVLVEKKVAETLVEKCAAIARLIRVGDPFAEGTEMGPLTLAKQRERVVEHVEDARRRGAVVRVGGKIPEGKGWYFPATVLAGVGGEMKLLDQETFGPLLPFVAVDSRQEAVRRANANSAGLCASIWTSDRSAAQHMAAQLEVGTATINDAVFTFGEPTACWGGVKQSGYGRTHGAQGLYEMIQWKYVSYDNAADPGPAWWYPYDRSYRDFVQNALPALYAPSLARRLQSLSQLARLKRFRESFHPLAVIKNLRKLF